MGNHRFVDLLGIVNGGVLGIVIDKRQDQRKNQRNGYDDEGSLALSFAMGKKPPCVK